MCFFKPKMPAMPAPPDRPTIQETSAPEPQALAVGGGDVTSDVRGTGSVKISLTKATIPSEAGNANISTGANTALSAGTKPGRASVTVTDKYPSPKIT